MEIDQKKTRETMEEELCSSPRPSTQETIRAQSSNFNWIQHQPSLLYVLGHETIVFVLFWIFFFFSLCCLYAVNMHESCIMCAGMVEDQVRTAWFMQPCSRKTMRITPFSTQIGMFFRQRSIESVTSLNWKEEQQHNHKHQLSLHH